MPKLSDLGRRQNCFERDLREATSSRSIPASALLRGSRPPQVDLGVDDILVSRPQILDRILPIIIGALIAPVALGTPLVLLLSRRLSRAA